VHFAVDAMAATAVSAAPVNGRGDRQRTISRPGCCSALLVYSYETRAFSGPQIERTAQENLAVRALCADTQRRQALPLKRVSDSVKTERLSMHHSTHHLTHLDTPKFL
jgi:hypothetical protein